jgi:hypothetical protein
MTKRPMYLIDGSLRLLGNLEVSPVGNNYEGTIDFGHPPQEMRQLFTEFEEIVEGQMFSLLEQIEERIRAAQIQAIWNDGQNTPVEELQVFPSTGAVSFRATRPDVVPLNGSTVARRPTIPFT